MADLDVPRIVAGLAQDLSLRITNQAVKTGRRRASAVRTKTYLVPDVGIFQCT